MSLSKKSIAWTVPVFAALMVLWAGVAQAQRYQLGHGDVLDLRVWNEPDLDGKIEVGSDGMAEFPLIGPVKAEGVTISELEATVESELADGYLKDPQLKLSIEEYKSKEVYVLGAVQKPGAVPLKRDMRLLEVLAQTGGNFGEGGEEILVVRYEGTSSTETESAASAAGAPEIQEGNPGSKILRVDTKDLLHGEPEANLLLQNRDTVLFPPKGRSANQVFVLGNVEEPGPHPITEDMRLPQLIATVGAATQMQGAQVAVTRRGKDGMKSVTFGVRDVIMGKEATDFDLRNGDVLLFMQPQDRYFVIGEVKAPGAFKYQQGLTVREGIIYAGWISRRGDLDSIQISRKVDGDWKDMNAKLSDPVQPGDVIRVKERWF